MTAHADLVARLREAAGDGPTLGLLREAADALEAQAAELERTRDLLNKAREAGQLPGHVESEAEGFDGTHRMAALLGLATMDKARVIEVKHDDAEVYLAQFLANWERRGMRAQAAEIARLRHEIKRALTMPVGKHAQNVLRAAVADGERDAT